MMLGQMLLRDLKSSHLGSLYDLTTPVYDKDYILSKASESEILEFYTGQTVQFGKQFRSPFRVDRFPTAGFFRHRNGQIWYKDFNGSFTGNCFDLVMHVYGLTLKDACKKIASDLRLDDRLKPLDFVRRQDAAAQSSILRERKELSIKVRGWEQLDRNYWTQFGISRKTLNIYRVFPVSAAWENAPSYHAPYLFYGYDPKCPCYAYKFEKGLKLYVPLRKKKRFRTNTDEIQGHAQLPPDGKLLIITKSLKDVMVFYELLRIPSVAPQGESHLIEEDMMESYKKRFARIVVFYDNDEAGRTGADKLAQRYSLSTIELPEELGSKDVSDLVRDRGKHEATDILKNILKELLYEAGYKS